jgi:hypothetical protein
LNIRQVVHKQTITRTVHQRALGSRPGPPLAAAVCADRLLRSSPVSCAVVVAHRVGSPEARGACSAPLLDSHWGLV